MFGKKNATGKPQDRIDSLVGVGTRIEGDIMFSGGLRIDGEVKGNIVVDEDKAGTLFVSEKARVEGDITVSHLMVNGSILGSVIVRETLELQSSARVDGDVEYLQLEMQPGAVVQGRLIHRAEKGAAELKRVAAIA